MSFVNKRPIAVFDSRDGDSAVIVDASTVLRIGNRAGRNDFCFHFENEALDELAELVAIAIAGRDEFRAYEARIRAGGE